MLVSRLLLTKFNDLIYTKSFYGYRQRFVFEKPTFSVYSCRILVSTVEKVK